MFTEITPHSHYKDQTFLCTSQNRPYLCENRAKYANHFVGKKKVLVLSPGDFAKWRKCVLTSTRLSITWFNSPCQPRLPHF
jgi:hypothetical protein